MKQGFFRNDGLQKWDGVETLPNDNRGPFVGRMGASASARPDEQPCAERFATPLCTNGLVQDLTLEETDLTLEEADVKSELTLEETGAGPDAMDLTTGAPAASSTDPWAAAVLQHPSFDAGACDQALRTRRDDTVEPSAFPPPGARVPACRPRWRHLAPRSVPLTFDDVELWFIEEEVMVALLWEELSGVRATCWDSDSDS